MVRLNTIGQDVVMAALLLLACWGVGQPAFAAPPIVDPAEAIADFTVALGAGPDSFRLDKVFKDGVNPQTYSVVSSDSAVVDAVASGANGRDLTLTYLSAGTATITATVIDGNSPADTLDYAFKVTVIGPNNPPLFTGSLPTTAPEDVGTVSVDLSSAFSDPDVADTLIYSVIANSNATLFAIAPTVSGNLLTFDLAPDQNGAADITIRATDPLGLFAQGDFGVSVTPVNDDPFVSSPIADINTGEDSPPIPILLDTHFGDVDIATNGDTLTYSVTANDNSAFVTTAISGSTLTLSFAANMSGVANITVEAKDSFGLTVDDSFIVTVDSVDDFPAAVDDSVVMTEDSGPVVIAVLANDTSGDNPTVIIDAGTTLIVGSPPVSYPNSSESPPTTLRDETGTDVTLPNGALLISGGAISYAPKANFTGTDFFHYTIQDADGQTSTGTVNITVDPLNDVPTQAGSLAYTVVQASALQVLAAGGIASEGFDADGDTITVIQDTVPASLGLGFPGTTLGVLPDGAFLYTPDATFIGTDSFVIRLFDGTTFSTPITVTVEVTAAPLPPPPPPPGEVEFDFDLANVPLEDAVSAEANVLVIMDDSGSMDWALMTDGAEGQLWLTNAGIKDPGTGTSTREYRYLVPLASNVYGNDRILPTEAALAADPVFLGNNYGVWRGRNSQYNTIYYNPQIQYKPWVGLDRNNVDFANASATAALLDPYEAPLRTINLTTPLTYISNNVPRLHGGGSSRNLTNNNVYLPHYYTTTAAGRPAWNDPHALVEISDTRAVDMAGAARDPAMTYVGGPNRLDCAIATACTYAEEIQNFANWFTYYRSREYTAKAALGRTVADVSNIRLGYVVLNDTNERTSITSMNASYRVGNKLAMMNQIYKIDSNNGTPLRVALDRAGKYFECRAGGSFGSPNTTPGDARCPVLPSPEGQCQNNYALLFSDGTWNENFTTGANGNAARNNDVATSSAFDGGKYGDAIAATLADVAMYYYERDLHPTLANSVPTTQRDYALPSVGAPLSAFGPDGEVMHQHMKTYTVGLGLEGLLDPATIPANYATPFAWGDPFNDGPSKVDDMLHAAVNGRGEFLKANNPVLLSQALTSAFQEFSNGSVSVSAVAFNSTALREQTVEYRGFFNLKYNTGDLRALNVDATTGFVDELSPIWRAAQVLDTQSADSRVIVTYDRINDAGIPFRFADLNADQKLVMNLNEVNFIRGDRSQEEPAGAFRARPLIEGKLGDIVHSAPQFVGGPRAIRRDQSPYPTTELYSAFKDAQATRDPLVYVAANDGLLHGFDATTGRERLGYVPNKLIDGSQRFKNDLDQLTSLSYSHRFFVDITPSVEDVYMPPRKGAIDKDWTTVLVGGLGGGGKGYYALNVSNPAVDYSTEGNATNSVLWEFTDADDTYPVDEFGAPLGGGLLLDLGGSPIKDLGYTYSAAQVVMSNVSDGGSPAQKQWVSIFGNGYNSSAGIAKLFVLPLENGLNGWQVGDFMKLDTGEGVKAIPDLLAGLPNGLGTPTIIDVDLNGTADIAYAGDLFGNLYRFNMANPNPALWKATKLFQATYDTGASEVRQPITTQPYVFKHPTLAGFIVVVGTGSYVTEADGVSLEIQSVYGIWDRGEVAPATANTDAKTTRLVQQTVTNVVDESRTDFQNLRIVSANPVDYTPDVGVTAGVYGWYFDFVMPRPALTLQGTANPDTAGNSPPAVQFPGERAIRRFVPRGSSLLITTIIPRDANTCLRSPPGSTFPIDALTGGNPKRAILDLNNDGVIDGLDFVTVGGVQYAAGILFTSDDLNGQLVDPSLLLGTGDADFLFLSGGDEQITIRVAGPEDAKTGRLSWRELENAN